MNAKSIHPVLSCGLLLLCVACDSEHQIASSCEQGVCPQASAVQVSRCSLSSDAAEFVVTAEAGQDPQAVAGLCVPSPLNGDTTVNCEVYWIIPEEVASDPASDLQNCSDRAFLAPGETIDEGTTCVVQQLTDQQLASGKSNGWYYEPADAECVRGDSRLAFTEGAVPPEGVTVRIQCLTARGQAPDGSSIAVDAQECPQLAHTDADGVGAACTPEIVPPGGFDRRTASVEVGTEQCQTNVCLVFRLDGDPDPDCEPSGSGNALCASAAGVEAHVYCSCRCNAPPGFDGPTCECPDDFTCVDVLDWAPDALAGGYCVRNGPAL